ncbi:bacterioferritin-associated ferredoxin [Streptomyces sp. NPDC007971]|uniref:(2Fe-2S)-binding protein n=1 Tax=Streptomyces sp. NPDC007971 TaxID=3364799 RepID=UPI0036EFA78F
MTEREVLAAVEAGACDLESVRDATGANTGCGDCAHDIVDLIADRQEQGATPDACG